MIPLWKRKKRMRSNAGIKFLTSVVIIAIMASALGGMSYLFLNNRNKNQSETTTSNSVDGGNNSTNNSSDIKYINPDGIPQNDGIYYVESVIDGDTFRINYKGETVSVRLIGINTPEIDTQNSSAECYGVEAKEYLKNAIEGKMIGLSIDPKQDKLDKYGRLLRYAYFDDGSDIGSSIVWYGYGYEYTYDGEYYYQSAYKELQNEAKNNKRGLWQDNVCKETVSDDANTVQEPTLKQTTNCNIKGNISYNNGKKIYHVPGQKYYDETIINESAGERWFCSEEEAIAAGWRKSKE